MFISEFPLDNYFIYFPFSKNILTYTHAHTSSAFTCSCKSIICYYTVITWHYYSYDTVLHLASVAHITL